TSGESFSHRFCAVLQGGVKHPLRGVGNHLIVGSPSDPSTEARIERREGRTDPAGGSSPRDTLQAAARWPAGSDWKDTELCGVDLHLGKPYTGHMGCLLAGKAP